MKILWLNTEKEKCYKMLLPTKEKKLSKKIILTESGFAKIDARRNINCIKKDVKHNKKDTVTIVCGK